MAERCDLMVHHGDHGMRKQCAPLVALGAGEIVMPAIGADSEKRIDVAEFGTAVNRVLKNKAYLDSAQRVSQSMRQYGVAKGTADEVETFAVDCSARRLLLV